MRRSRDENIYCSPDEVQHSPTRPFALVGNDRSVINSKIDKIFNLVEDLNLAEIIDSEMEIINI